MTEYIDIVDHNNNIIGQASRQEAHKKDLMHRAAHIIVSHNDLVFLQLRAPQKSLFPNKWDSSAAGHLAVGEDYHKAAARELKEELGLDLSNLTDSLYKNLVEIGSLPASENNGYEFVKIYNINYVSIPHIELEYQEITTGGWFHSVHISKWLQDKPQDFAGGFDVIWAKFLEKY